MEGGSGRSREKTPLSRKDVEAALGRLMLGKAPERDKITGETKKYGSEMVIERENVEMLQRTSGRQATDISRGGSLKQNYKSDVSVNIINVDSVVFPTL